MLNFRHYYVIIIDYSYIKNIFKMAKKAAPKKRIIKGRDYNEDKRQDGLRSARSFGWRKAGTSRKPTKKEIQDHYNGASNGVYMENRPERGDNFGRAKKGERFEKGGSIDSSMRFTGNDYDKLIDSGKFEGVKNGNLYELKEIDSSKVIGKFNESKETLFIAGKKDLSNPLVVWLKDNSFMSSDNVDKLAKGGKIDRTKSTKKSRVNRTKKAIAQDKNIKALHAGKRLSENDEVYYEYRLNRSDVNRTKKLAKGGDLKNYTSADLPKDGSEIKIHMPEMGKFPAEDIVIKYNQDNFAFDAYRNGELSGTRITEKQVLDNLNNGSYEFKKDAFEGVELDRYKDFDFDSDGNLAATVNGKNYKVVYRDDKTQLYDLFEDGKVIKSDKEVRKVMKFEKGGSIKEVDFENSNVIFYGFSHDKNGNSVVKVGFPNQTAFSLQINDPSWFRFTKGKYTKNLSELEPSDVVKIEEEIVEYIRNFGSKKQKESLKVYSKFKGGVRDAKEINALLQDSIRKTKDLSAKEIADMWNANINTEISKSWTEEEVAGNISHFRSYLKDLLFEKELTEAEYSEYFEKGGKIGFEGLAKKVAKEYEGDKVKPEYQAEYGKTYDKEEALEVGKKVAAKVYRGQEGMMEKGGEIKSELTLSEIESKLGKTFGFWDVPYQVSVDGIEYRKKFGSNTYRKI